MFSTPPVFDKYAILQQPSDLRRSHRDAGLILTRLPSLNRMIVLRWRVDTPAQAITKKRAVIGKINRSTFRGIGTSSVFFLGMDSRRTAITCVFSNVRGRDRSQAANGFDSCTSETVGTILPRRVLSKMLKPNLFAPRILQSVSALWRTSTSRKPLRTALA